MNFDFPKEEQSIIKVIGVGGGGSNAVNHMFEQGIVGVDFAICNTDAQAMNISKVPVKMQLGPNLTDGRGAGSKPEVGEKAALESIDDVASFLKTNTKMLFITAGMGGGTGTGAAPVIAQLAKEMGILTVGIVTVPFKFEGRQRCRFATDGVDKLKENVDALIVISNNKLREIYGNLELSRAFANADNILTTAAKGIAEIITVPGIVNVDFEDVNTVMRNSGVAIMGSAIAEGENRARKAIDMALNSPLLEDSDIRGAKQILLNVRSGEREVTMDEICTITDYIQEQAGEDSNLIWGNCVDDNLGDKLCVTLIATGFEENELMSEIPMKVPAIETNLKQEEEPISFLDRVDGSKSETAVENETDEWFKELDDNTVEFDEEELLDEEVKKKLEASKEEIESRRDTNRNSTPKELSKEIINELESEPAYKRRAVKLEEVQFVDAENYSRLSISDNENDPLSGKNRFLHDNVD
ncbi:MAG: cell division protein FtsZ [Saprospirales bacterium]|nr:MAG: cell division protein FtsZ [Saprospirales bacterium]